MHAPAHSFLDPLSIHARRPSTWVVLALGALAAWAHVAFRFPLHMPGHHGLEWMALLVIARQLSSYRWAATLAGPGAALVAAIAMHDPLAPLTYLVPGVVLDLEYLLLDARARRSAVALAGIAAVAHAAKPLAQWSIASAFALPLSGAGQGLAYLLIAHAAYGFAGGLAGALLWRARPR